MKALEETILKKSIIIDNDIIKVDSFINHQVDPKLTKEVAKYFYEQFKDQHITKILTIETSGIPVAFCTADLFNVNMVFAKKTKSRTVDMSNAYSCDVKSFTRGTISNVTVSKAYLNENDVVLIVDDFLASGTAAFGLLEIIRQAKAKCVGVAVLIEKSFQGGRTALEKKGYKVVSGANIVAFNNNVPEFAK